MADFDSVLKHALGEYRKALEANVFGEQYRILPKPRFLTAEQKHEALKRRIEERAQQNWRFLMGEHECGW